VPALQKATKSAIDSIRTKESSIARAAAPNVASAGHVKQAVMQRQGSRQEVESAPLRAICAEEEALERSLLRLDFGEMRRQFGGQDPLWKKEAFEKSFEAHKCLGATQHENKIKDSLNKLDAALGNLRSELALRQEEGGEQCASRENCAPISRSREHPCSGLPTNRNKRVRPRSVGSYSQRVGAVSQPVVTLSAPPSDKAPCGRTPAAASQQQRSARPPRGNVGK
jgi:hypothetical protein